MARFKDMTVVVTGASSGIGEATARLVAAEGARLVLAARKHEALEQLTLEMRGSGFRALAVPTDVVNLESCRALLERAAAEFGGIDVLVNNAGENARGPVEDFQPEEQAKVIDVNLRAPIVLCRLAIPYIRRQGGGAIVNVASLAGRLPIATQAAYCASKFGLRIFTFALAEELRGSGIKVAVVSPGPVDTAFLTADVDRIADVTLAQPMSRAEDVAAMILDSASDGKAERIRPRLSGHLATLGYLLPGVRRALTPIWERRGRRAKERLRARKPV